MVTAQNNGIMLVSVNSGQFTPCYFDHVINTSKGELQTLTLLFLDEPEKCNLRVFTEYDEDEISWRVELLCEKIKEELPKSKFIHVDIIGWNEFAATNNLEKYISHVRMVQKNNKSFRNHCENQSYQNMQPLLNRIGITSKRHPALKGLAGYLIYEIAIKMYIHSNNIYDIEVAPRKEMNIIEAIYGGKYCEFNEYILEKQKYKVIEPIDSGNNLDIVNICCEYEKSNFKFENINLSIGSGEIHGILGPNGAGKTTLLEIIGGHKQPAGGSIRLGGAEITQLEPRRRAIITVFQNLALFPHLTVGKNIAYGLEAKKIYSRKLIKKMVARQLKDFNLEDWKNELPRKLSIGMQQRLAIARAMITDPLLLLLDEPTSSLDHKRRLSIIQALQDISPRMFSTTTVIVSHDRDFIFQLCDNISIMDKGIILASGATKELFRYPPTRIISEILQSGNLLEGYIDDDLQFTDKHEDIKINVDNIYSELASQRCYLLVREEDVILRSNDRENLILVEFNIVSIDYQGSYYWITGLTSGLQTMRVKILNTEFNSSIMRINHGFEFYLKKEGLHFLV